MYKLQNRDIIHLTDVKTILDSKLNKSSIMSSEARHVARSATNLNNNLIQNNRINLV